MAVQTEQTCENPKRALTVAGENMTDIAVPIICCRDIDDFGKKDPPVG